MIIIKYMANTLTLNQQFDLIEYQRDFKRLNRYIDLEYDKLFMFFDILYNHKEVFARINEILTKYKDKNFYFKYEADNKKWLGFMTHETKGWRIYDEDTIQNIVPENINLNKICYPKGQRPYTNIEYPANNVSGYLTRLRKIKNYKYIRRLGILHSNLYIIHPKLPDGSVLEDLLNKK